MADLAPVPIANPAQTPSNPLSNRSKKRQANLERKAPYPKRNGQKHGKGPEQSAGGAGAGAQVQGVSKLKAAIRQTTRLLARETLDPALRISTERRLASLKRDIAQAEARSTEKEYGKKYHMVKFFDRKKLLRLITRNQRNLANVDSAEPSAGSSSSSPPKTALEAELWQARVMLNYVDNFPNSHKYISLFPTSSSSAAPESDAGAGSEADDPDGLTARALVLPPHLNSLGPGGNVVSVKEPTLDQSDSRTNIKGKGKKKDKVTEPPADPSSAKRLSILLRVSDLMRSGGLSTEPEKQKERKAGGVGAGSGGLVDIMPVKEVQKTGSSSKAGEKSGKAAKVEKVGKPIVEEDGSSGASGSSDEADQVVIGQDKGDDGIEDDFFE